MKASSLSTLALGAAISASSLPACSNETTVAGYKTKLLDPTANSHLAKAHKLIGNCAAMDDVQIGPCLEQVVTIKNKALESAGLSPETEQVKVSCTGGDPCAIVVNVRDELCKYPECKIVEVK